MGDSFDRFLFQKGITCWAIVVVVVLFSCHCLVVREEMAAFRAPFDMVHDAIHDGGLGCLTPNPYGRRGAEFVGNFTWK